MTAEKTAAAEATRSSSRTSTFRPAGAALSVGLAIFANYVIRSIMVPELEPIGEKCFAGNYQEVEVPFEPALGGSFVCIITTFFHGIVTGPAGRFAWGAIVTVFLANIPIMVMESIRSTTGSTTSSGSGMKGIFLSSPFVVMLLGQYIAISVAFPLLWVPSYILFSPSGTQTRRETTSLLLGRQHQLFIFGLVAWTLVSSAFLFGLDTESYAWTVCAGVVGGPLFAVPWLIHHLLPKTTTTTTTTQPSSRSFKELSTSSSSLSSSLVDTTYQVVFVACILVWLLSIACLVQEFGTKTSDSVVGAIFDGAFINTNASVLTIQVDWLVWFTAYCIVLFQGGGNNPLDDVVIALVSMIILGPGAALLLVFWKQEKQRRIDTERLVAAARHVDDNNGDDDDDDDNNRKQK